MACGVVSITLPVLSIHKTNYTSHNRHGSHDLGKMLTTKRPLDLLRKSIRRQVHVLLRHSDAGMPHVAPDGFEAASLLRCISRKRRQAQPLDAH